MLWPVQWAVVSGGKCLEAALPSRPRICPESRVHSRGPCSKHVKLKTRGKTDVQNSRTGVQGCMLLSACPWPLGICVALGTLLSLCVSFLHKIEVTAPVFPGLL